MSRMWLAAKMAVINHTRMGKNCSRRVWIEDNFMSAPFSNTTDLAKLEVRAPFSPVTQENSVPGRHSGFKGSLSASPIESNEHAPPGVKSGQSNLLKRKIRSNTCVCLTRALCIGGQPSHTPKCGRFGQPEQRTRYGVRNRVARARCVPG